MVDVATILERYRSGRVSRGKLELAAYCGSGEARDALSRLELESRLPAHRSDDEFRQLLLDGHAFMPDWAAPFAAAADDEVALRAAFAAVKAHVDRWVGGEDPDSRFVVEVIEKVGALLADPGEAARQGVRDCRARLEEMPDWETPGHGSTTPAAIASLVDCALGDRSAAVEAIDCSSSQDAHGEPDNANQDVEIRQAVIEAMVPWLLGEGHRP